MSSVPRRKYSTDIRPGSRSRAASGQPGERLVAGQEVADLRQLDVEGHDAIVPARSESPTTRADLLQ